MACVALLGAVFVVATGFVDDAVAATRETTDATNRADVSGVHLWERWEDSFSSTSSYDNKYRDVTLLVHLTSPENVTSTISGFWDGGSTWKVRFAFPHAGTWTYETECTNTNDSGLHGRTGSISVAEYSGTNPLYARGFPRADGAGEEPPRFLQYWDGEPFLYFGDTTWFPWGNFSLSGWGEYLDDRLEKGFTVIQTSLGFNNWWDFWSPGGCSGSATSGTPPWFGTVGRAELYNPAFYQVVDAFVQMANERGIMIGVFGIMNAGDNGVIQDSDRERFARTIAARLQGNATTLSPSVDDYWTLQESVDSTGDHLHQMDDIFYSQMQTAHLETNAYNCDDTGSPGNYNCDFHDAPWLDVNGYQSGHNAPQGDEMILWAVRRAREMPLEYYNRFPAKPVINIEPLYSMPPDWFPPNADLDDNAYRCRQIGWYTFLSGGCGHAYGIWGIWDFGRYHQGYCGSPRVNWRDAIDNEYSRQAEHTASFLNLIPWHRLLPRNDLIRDQTADERAKQALAMTDDGDVLVAYVPRGHEIIRLDTRQMSEGGTCHWYDPRTGIFHYAGGWSNNNSGRVFVIPDFVEDWVLLLVVDSYPTSGIDESSATLPAGVPGLKLWPVYPNPHATGTTIDFELAAGGRTRLSVHDVAGRLVRTLVDSDLAGPGRYHYRWDGFDGRGDRASAGVYFITVATQGREATQKVIRLR